MSEAAQKQLETLVEQNAELYFEDAVHAVENQQDVSEVTARTYVRDYTETEKNQHGEKVVTDMRDTSDKANSTMQSAQAQQSEGTQASEDDVVALAEEAGEPTGDDFYGLPTLGKPNHAQIPEMNVDYKVREIDGTGRTDAQILAKTMADRDFSTLLIGETGVGKDMLTKYVCAKTNRPAVYVNFGVNTTYEKLVGMYQPSNHPDKDFEWKDGLLTTAVRNGWTFVADELNAAPPEATMPLHGVTQGEGESHLTIQETGEVITPHPEFKFVGTMNPEHYAGTKELNEAFKTRFFPIRIDYMDSEAEVELIEEETPIRGRDAKRLVNLANKLREQQKNQTITTAVSTREMLKIGKMSGDNFMSVADAASMLLEAQANPDDRQAISKAIESHL